MSVTSNPASRKALRVGLSVLVTKFSVSSTSFCAFSFKLISFPVLSTLVMSASWFSLSHSFTSRDFVRSSRVSSWFSGGSLASASIQQKIRWSKSSPPKAESPLVANTSKIPLDKRKIEISKVPPPKS